MQLSNSLECSYFNLPRINLLNPISQRVMQQVHEEENHIPTTTKRKKAIRLKHVLQHNNPKSIQKVDFPNMAEFVDKETTNQFPKLKIKLIPAREDNSSKLSLDKFTFKDPNTPRPVQMPQRRQDHETSQRKSSSLNNKMAHRQQNIQMEQLKTVQQTILYYLSQQTNKLDHHFDLLENQLSQNLKTGSSEITQEKMSQAKSRALANLSESKLKTQRSKDHQ